MVVLNKVCGSNRLCFDVIYFVKPKRQSCLPRRSSKHPTAGDLGIDKAKPWPDEELKGLTLPLFMARICADYVHATFAADNFAVFADSFNTGADFHRSLLSKFSLSKARQYRNCLLYTSPSPRDRQKSRMPSSA